MRHTTCKGYLRGDRGKDCTGGRCLCGLHWSGREQPYHNERGQVMTDDGHVVKDPDKYLLRKMLRRSAVSEAQDCREELSKAGRASAYGQGHARVR